MAKDATEFIPTRATLLGRLKDWDDQESWDEFFDTYAKLIHRAALKAGLTQAEAEDVVQETILSVAKKMPRFKYDPAVGSFKGWLLQLTRWRILNQFRKRPPTQPLKRARSDETSRTSTEDQVADPDSFGLEAFWQQEWQQNLMEAALERVKRKANPKDYRVFYLHVLKQQPAREVARTLNLNLAQVYLGKSRVSALVRKAVKHLEKKMI